MRANSLYVTAHHKLAHIGSQALMVAWIITATQAFAAQPVPEADSSTVVAAVGSHQIRQQQVDDKLNLQLYNARKAVIDQMVDGYLLQQAAESQKLSVTAYLKRETDDKAAAEVNEAAARRFYEENKDKLPALKSAGSFNKIKDRLLAALRRQAAGQKRSELLAELREQGDVKILLQPPRVQVATAGNPS